MMPTQTVMMPTMTGGMGGMGGMGMGGGAGMNDLRYRMMNYGRKARTMAILGALCTSCLAFIFLPLLAASLLAFTIYFGKYIDSLPDLPDSAATMSLNTLFIVLIAVMVAIRQKF
ncbi:hypothetical protein SNEBB_009774 [Seison nebaliae]|nr:hypothetical protein SNEBB_009774 [Seison nebaliae]